MTMRTSDAHDATVRAAADALPGERIEVVTLLSCPACASPSSKTVALADTQARARFLSLSQLKYQGCMNSWLQYMALEVRRCDACGHLWYSQQPAQPHLFDMYCHARALPSLATSHSVAPRVAREMATLRRYFPADRAPTLLDFGAGSGVWVRAGADAGFQGWAYEPVASRSDRHDPRIQWMHDLDQVQGRVWDAVNLEQVLEHVGDPVAVLRDVRQLLSDRGILRVTVPNLDRIPVGRLWDDWPFGGKVMHALSPFEHLHGFCAESLRMAIRRGGYESLPGYAVIRREPALFARHCVGRAVRRFSSTKLYLRVAGRPMPPGAH